MEDDSDFSCSEEESPVPDYTERENVLDTIKQYQKYITRYSEQKMYKEMLPYISKLYSMPVTVAHLQETGIGRTVNSLRKIDEPVGNASRALIGKWKSMVEEEERTEPSDYEHEDTDLTSVKHQKKIKMESSNGNHRTSSSENEKKNKHHDHHSESSNRHHKHNRKREEESSSSIQKSSHSSSDRKHNSKHTEPDRKEKHEKHSKERNDKKRKYEEDDQSNKYLKRSKNDSESSEDINDMKNHINSSTSYEEKERKSPKKDRSYESENHHSKHKKHHKHKSEKHKKHDKERTKDKEYASEHHSKKSSHKEKKNSEYSENRSKPEETCDIIDKVVSPEMKLSSSTTSSSSSSLKIDKYKSDKVSSSSKKVCVTTPSKGKKEIHVLDNDGIDCGSGASFAEALGMLGPSPTIRTNSTKKKSLSASPTPSTSSSKTSTPKSKSSNTSSVITPTKLPSSPLTQAPSLLVSSVKLEPLDTVIEPPLLEITTNYKPLPNNYYDITHSINSLRHMTEDEALGVMITQKPQRTKVFSGNKTNWGYVPTLFNLCVRVLQDNIDSLEYTGGVPYQILKPVLERATADQLFMSEHYNPYLIEDTDELWELHCKKEFRSHKRQEMESWRDMYMRCMDEREAKLKALTANIKKTQDKSIPVRTTKLAYVDSHVKPPRAIARKQARYGTDKKPLVTATSKLNSIASANYSTSVSVPNPGARAASSSSSSVIKPKKAPLMQKMLAAIKSRYRR